MTSSQCYPPFLDTTVSLCWQSRLRHLAMSCSCKSPFPLPWSCGSSTLLDHGPWVTRAPGAPEWWSDLAAYFRAIQGFLPYQRFKVNPFLALLWSLILTLLLLCPTDCLLGTCCSPSGFDPLPCFWLCSGLLFWPVTSRLLSFLKTFGSILDHATTLSALLPPICDYSEGHILGLLQ